MGSINKVILVGHLGRDAESATTASGVAVARFSLATSTRVKNSQSGTWDDRTEWHRVVLFGRQAESLRDYLRKGTMIGIDGRLQTRSWEDKDGQKRYTTEVVADRVELLGGGDRGARAGAARREESPYDEGDATTAAPVTDDDIPF